MNKIFISKEFYWNMAHILSDHKGLCKNLHGHTYRMQVQISRKNKGLLQNTLHSDGMVIDFSDLKDIVQKKFIDPLDHAFMHWRNSNDPVEHQIAELLKNNGKKVITVNYRPTVEEIALNFFAELSRELHKNDIIVESIRIWETAASYAEVTRED
ncbi:MAG: 6-carboxytetrahydropterin synthase QueD [Firmicutes bacterium HGW-Firmicutes-13]|nr:MAG: 6-carboxytetrahydropterin synthase QueD [Firmicutes bacterium HGW-Firmicutes-13]